MFSRYNNGIEYVQGMNTIVAVLCTHTQECVAFWLFIGLLENFNLDDVYKTGLRGVYLYIEEIEKTIASKLPRLHQHLSDLGINYDMFAINWVLSLF